MRSVTSISFLVLRISVTVCFAAHPELNISHLDMDNDHNLAPVGVEQPPFLDRHSIRIPNLETECQGDMRVVTERGPSFAAAAG
jgi:hypothetical protein